MLKAAQYQKGLNIILSSAFLRCHMRFSQMISYTFQLRHINGMKIKGYLRTYESKNS